MEIRQLKYACCVREVSLFQSMVSVYLCELTYQNLFSMTPADRQYFPSDVRQYDWKEFSYNYYLGLLRYIGKEKLDDSDACNRRMQKLVIAHYAVLIVYYLLIALFWYSMSHLFGLNGFIKRTYADFFY